MAEFTYFDQFEDISVDLTNYLQNLSITGYDYRFNELQPIVTNLKNLFTHYEIVDQYKKNIDVIINYVIPENYGIDQVSYDYYGTVDYWWIILVFNNIKNPWLEWPFTQEQLSSLATLLYNEEGKYNYDTYHNFLLKENEIKRQILLPKNYVIKDFIQSYRDQIAASS